MKSNAATSHIFVLRGKFSQSRSIGFTKGVMAFPIPHSTSALMTTITKAMIMAINNVFIACCIEQVLVSRRLVPSTRISTKNALVSLELSVTECQSECLDISRSKRSSCRSVYYPSQTCYRHFPQPQSGSPQHLLLCEQSPQMMSVA